METALRMGSRLPAELADVVILLETGWTWQELMATPPEVVDDLRLFLNKRGLIIREKQRLMEANR